MSHLHVPRSTIYHCLLGVCVCVCVCVCVWGCTEPLRKERKQLGILCATMCSVWLLHSTSSAYLWIRFEYNAHSVVCLCLILNCRFFTWVGPFSLSLCGPLFNLCDILHSGFELEWRPPVQMKLSSQWVSLCMNKGFMIQWLIISLSLSLSIILSLPSQHLCTPPIISAPFIPGSPAGSCCSCSTNKRDNCNKLRQTAPLINDCRKPVSRGWTNSTLAALSTSIFGTSRFRVKKCDGGLGNICEANS